MSESLFQFDITTVSQQHTQTRHSDTLEDANRISNIAEDYEKQAFQTPKSRPEIETFIHTRTPDSRADETKKSHKGTRFQACDTINHTNVQDSRLIQQLIISLGTRLEADETINHTRVSNNRKMNQ